MIPKTIQQSSTLPPAQPTYIFRGHDTQIHSLHFMRQNARLLSGDADGWVVLWDVVLKRPKVVWKAHENTILGINHWGDDRVVTHGRDNKLNCWQLKPSEEHTFSSILPIEDSSSYRKQPWLLHSLSVNTMNFCSFAMCIERAPVEVESSTAEKCGDILLAVPGTKDTEIHIFQLPSEKRAYVIPALSFSTGMIMALSVFYDGSQLRVVAGYEGGHTALHCWIATSKKWTTSNISQSHKQPILALDICMSQTCYFTSGADDIISRHTLLPEAIASQNSSSSSSVSADTSLVFIHTKHSGQQALRVRSDEKVFGTAGWDARIRIYSTKTMKELAVLKWHKEGCYAIAFAKICDKRSQKMLSDERSNATVAMPTARMKREDKVMETHWLAAGSKDGKVSLWDIY